MNKIVLLWILITVAVVAAGASFLLPWMVGTPTEVHETTVEGIYERGESFLKSGDQDKAINLFSAIADKYSGSLFSEKSLRQLAGIYSEKGDQAKAEQYYARLLKEFPGIKDADSIRSIVGEMSTNRINSLIEKDSIEYTVKSGDSLYVLARKYNTTIELIKQMNGLRSDTIRIGQKLKINTSEFSIFVDKSSNILILKKDGKLFKKYIAATGRNNSTPVGIFTIVDKMVKPPWTKPGVGVIMPDSEEYELGARWMSISVKGYGIHGTNDNSSLGGQATAGCVRLSNEDVIELYNLVPRGTRVEIID